MFPLRALVLGLASLSLLALTGACTTDAADAPPAEATSTVPIGAKCTTDDECGGGRCESNACVPGRKCTDDSECGGARCIDNGCAPATCVDGAKNSGETDVDCGGAACPRCAAGKACVEATDCADKVCASGVCAPASATDGVENGTETDVDCGGGAPTDAPRCADGLKCKVGDDCVNRICGSTGTCTPATTTDGVKNGNETDVDCGGFDAPRCAEGKACKQGEDCDSRFCTDDVCEPRKAGRKDGDETDVDCGGSLAPKCDWDKACLVDADCTSNACSGTNKCLTGPSCRVTNGGQTCGPNGDADCCRSLAVTNYPQQDGKTVYLDKYEITAGRMRAFVDTVTAAQGGVPDIKGYMAANRPARWHLAWEAVLPSNTGLGNQPGVMYTIANPTPAQSQPLSGFLYPGQDVYLSVRTQTSWSVSSGTYTIYPGLAQTFGEYHFFPEYNPEYAASHALNCSNEKQSYGVGTYWMPTATIQAISAKPPENVTGRAFTQAQMDQRALNCTTFAMFAAFCAWDGGQLVTEEVMQHVVNGRIGSAGNCTNGINMADDSSKACYAVWYEAGSDADDSGRIAPPGRIAADVVKIAPSDEGWFDLKGNLLETVVKSNDRFDYKGYGLGYASVTHHKAQIMTPRNKGGSFGARCMRLK
ncbi:MAG: hypothetical protein J0I07_43945 [Myxococcales bacterium]|nr:hypothetical protein [Myxococcales bacterium]